MTIFGDRHWWQYVVALGIMILGFIFIYAGKIESVIIDKNRSLLEVSKTSIFCVSKKQVDDLELIHNVRGVKKGHEGVNFYTIHYVIYAEFRNKPPIKIMDSQNRRKTIKQVSASLVSDKSLLVGDDKELFGTFLHRRRDSDTGHIHTNLSTQYIDLGRE